MSAAGLIVSKLVPLYLLVAVGYWAGRKLKVQKESIAPLLIYIITPLVVFQGVLEAHLKAEHFLLPAIFFVICCLICLTWLKVTSQFFPSPAKNILAFGAGNANSGYFAIPVALSFYGEASVALVILMSFGFILYENTLGFFITARGHSTLRESLKRVARLPTVYAFALAVILSHLGVHISSSYHEWALNIRNTYSVLGMMMIGIASASRAKAHFDARFVAFALTAKFLVWPCVMLVWLALDTQVFHVFDTQTHQLMKLMAALPMAANTVAIATELRAEPEKAAVAVLISTVLALITIPWVLS